jgi:hypothetical protein
MYTLRCTQRLLRRLPLDVTANPPASTTRLGDWYANLLFLQHQHLVLCTSERSLLSVIVPAKDPQRLPLRLRDAAQSLFRELGYHSDAIAAEMGAMAELAVGKTANRSVLGSMNDIVHHCRWHAANRPTLRIRSLELELAEMPSLILDCTFPREQTALLLGAA